jgi:O-methyltransferase
MVYSHFLKEYICIDDTIHIVDEMIKQLVDMGIPEEKIALTPYLLADDPRVAYLKRLAKELDRFNVMGMVAEVGVWRGHFAAWINKFFKERTLYLFDTFAGHTKEDVEKENSLFGVTDVTKVYESDDRDLLKVNNEIYAKLRCPYSEKVVLKKGYVPKTFEGLENESFAFVNIDVDIYPPAMAALEFFAPRMNKGGVIWMHDYNEEQFPGAVAAVQELGSRYPITVIPTGDDYTVAIVISKNQE